MANDNPAGVPVPVTRDQHQAKIKSFGNWIEAVSAGTFQGKHSLHVATLLNLLEAEHKQAIEQFESESLTHPEWGSARPA